MPENEVVTLLPPTGVCAVTPTVLVTGAELVAPALAVQVIVRLESAPPFVGSLLVDE
jgi:hypothetical protein